MPLATDRDLLVLEPAVFHEIPFASQQRLRVSDATVAGTTLTSDQADFVGTQVDAGAVVVLGDVAVEVVQRLDAHRLTISLPRGSPNDAPLAPVTTGAPDAALTAAVRSFAPQLAAAHDTLLRMLGLDPDDPDALPESAIVSRHLVGELEAFAALGRLYGAAAAAVGDNANLLTKAALYRRRFAELWRGARVLLDTDADGRADDAITPGSVRLERV